MTSGYPSFSHSAKKGEAGVNCVAQIVNDRFGWVFKKNHQEYDFGIDGQLEVVTPAGHVTGQLAAVQIKYGGSYFSEKNKWGYVYRGEKKHFNYLSNYPIPVLIVICHPDTNQCLWVKFDASQTNGTENGWKITIPFENNFRDAKQQILALLPESKDNLSELEQYWVINKLLSEASCTLFVFDSHDIGDSNTSRIREFFDRLRSSKELAHSCRGTLEFSFSGYDDDAHELFEIPQICQYFKLLSDVLPELLFFIRTKAPCHTLPLFAFCIGQGKVSGQRATTIGTRHRVEFETKPVMEFLSEKWSSLNEMTDWLGMSIDENKEVTYDVIRCLGFKVPDD